MANAVVGALRVNLGLDSAQFQDGLKKAEGGLSKFSTAVKVGLAAAAAAVATAGAGMALAIKGVLDEADTMSKAAQSLGVPIEELSRLKHAADMSGVSFEGLSTSLRRLGQSMTEALAKPTGEAARIFQGLQIALTNADGSARTSSEVMSDLADRFSRMEDGAAKTALAVQLFGRAGADMIPMLNAGRDGLQEMKDEADALGIVIDQGTGKAAEAFNDNLSRLTKMANGLWVELTSRLAEGLELISNWLVETSRETKNFEAAVDAAAVTIKALVSAAVVAAGAMVAVAKDVAFAAKLLGGIASLDFEGVAKTWAEGSGSQEITKNVEDLMSRLWSKADEIQAAAPETARKIASPIDAAAIMINAGADKAKGGIDKAAREAENAAKRLAEEGKRVFEATRTPAEALAIEIERLNGLLNAGAIDWDTYQRAVEQAQDKMQNAGKKSNEIAMTMQSSFMTVFDDIVNGTFRAADALRKLVADIAKMMANKIISGFLNYAFGKEGPLGFLNLNIGKNAQGTNNWKGGLTWVGERGPEIVNLPRGSQVIPNHEIGKGGGDTAVSINVNVEGARGNAEIMHMVQAGVRQGIAVYDRSLPTRLAEINQRYT